MRGLVGSAGTVLALGLTIVTWLGCGEDVEVDYPLKVPPAVSQAVPDAMQIRDVQKADINGEGPLDIIYLYGERGPDGTKVLGLVADVDGVITAFERPGWQLQLITKRADGDKNDLVLMWIGAPSFTEVVFWGADGFQQRCELAGVHPSGC